MDAKQPGVVLDRERTALLIIDVQRALFSRSRPIYKAEDLLRAINDLIAMWKRSKGLVIYIQHSNDKFMKKNVEGWRLHPDLSIEETDIIVHKHHGNAFEKTNLKEILDSNGIETIVITGLVTQGCVRATSIGGHEQGYRVVLVEDGHSNYSNKAEKIIKRWNRDLSKEYVELCSSDEIGIQ